MRVATASAIRSSARASWLGRDSAKAVGARGVQPFAYSSAVSESNSNPTTASSPTTQASCPGLDHVRLTRADFVFGAVIVDDVHRPRLRQTDVVGLAGFASRDRLDALRPSPARLQPHARRIGPPMR